jgi:hypothetical protein
MKFCAESVVFFYELKKDSLIHWAEITVELKILKYYANYSIQDPCITYWQRK